MQVGGEVDTGGELGPARNDAVRPRVPVVARPRQVERPLAGRRAPGERGVRPVRPAGREVPARAREPGGHYVPMSRSTDGGVLREPMPA